MRIGRTVPTLLALCISTAGCELASNAVHNVNYEAKLAMADCAERCRYEKMATNYWKMVEKSQPCVKFSKDYVGGFKDGFVDFIQYGGKGEPPDLPPQQYWGPRYRTPQGYLAIEAWYAGFRHGAAVAQESGRRQWAVVPSAQSLGLSAPVEMPVAAPGIPSEAPPVVIEISKRGETVPQEPKRMPSFSAEASGLAEGPVLKVGYRENVSERNGPIRTTFGTPSLAGEPDVIVTIAPGLRHRPNLTAEVATLEIVAPTVPRPIPSVTAGQREVKLIEPTIPCVPPTPMAPLPPPKTDASGDRSGAEERKEESGHVQILIFPTVPARPSVIEIPSVPN